MNLMRQSFFKIIIPLLFSLTVKSFLFAQDTIITSLDSSKVYYFNHDFETAGPEFLKPIDTIITSIQKYDPVSKPGNYYATLGNIGDAAINMTYKPVLKSGFDFGNTHSFEKFLFYNDSLTFNWVGTPYTHLKYVMGSKKEQNLSVDASQNISKWINVGLTFRYTNGPGYYPNQQSDDKNFAFKTRFQTKDYRYMVLAVYLHNKIRVEENGGIKYDSIFEQNIEQSRQNYEVNLKTAKTGYKENTYYIKQYFFLSKRHRFRLEDEDSLAPHRKIIPGNISLSSLYSRKIHLYQQELTDKNGFYRYTYDSVNPTYDSTFITIIENQLSWTNTDNAKSQLLTFNFAVKHLYTEFTLDSAKTYISQLIPSGEVDFTVSDILRLGFMGDFVTGNASAGDYHLKGILSINTKWGELSYTLTHALQEPDYFYKRFYSNHFRWDNILNKESFVLNNIQYSLKNLHAGVNLINIGSFVYMDSLAMPAQLGDNLNVFSAYLRKLIHLGNWSFDLRGVYQNASNSALRVPEFVGDVSIYYTKDLFKKAAILQPGVDVFYNTSYFGYAYMPAIKSFYLQDEKKVGNYFYGDVFLNLQIKRARLSLKYVNLGYLFKDFSYYTVPSYPMQDGGFRFGLSWMFYD
jgi:hypothetical protein